MAKNETKTVNLKKKKKSKNLNLQNLINESLIVVFGSQKSLESRLNHLEEKAKSVMFIEISVIKISTREENMIVFLETQLQRVTVKKCPELNR